MTTTSRAQRWLALYDHYEPSVDRDGEPDDAFVLVQRSAPGDVAFVTSNDRARLMTRAADDLLRGWVPVALYDLDRAELTTLGLGPLVVVPDTNQDRMMNPLAGRPVIEDAR